MTAPQILIAVFLACIPLVAGGLVAFGVVKGKMSNYVTFEQHREMCGDQRNDIGIRIDRERVITNREIDRLISVQDTTLKLVSEIHGYLKAQNGGSL